MLEVEEVRLEHCNEMLFAFLEAEKAWAERRANDGGRAAEGRGILDEVVFGDANGNRVLSNSIFSNKGLGIDLGNNGPTPNDPQDTDFGPNTLQNTPVLTSAETTGTRIILQGRLNSTPNSTFTIRFFSNAAGNEGKTFLGLKSGVSTDANGNVSFTRVLAVGVPAGQRITATATGPGGNTSEFSGARVVVEQ